VLSHASKVVKTNLSAEQVLTYVARLELLNPTKIGHGVAKGPTGWAGQQSIVVLGTEAHSLFADFRDGNLS
jgi:hypothetical protein